MDKTIAGDSSCLQQYQQAKSSTDLKPWVMQYAKVIHRIAQDIKAKCPPHVELDDLLQAGFLGLLEAKDSYLPGTGAQFTTYATLKIKFSIYECLRKSSGITRDISQNIKKIASAMSIIANKEQPSSSTNIANQLGISLNKYHAISQEINAYEGMTTNKEQDHANIPCPEEDNPLHHTLQTDLMQLLQSQIKMLPAREQMLLSLYYTQQLNFKEIGNILYLTEARVSQLHALSMRKLKQKLIAYEVQP